MSKMDFLDNLRLARNLDACTAASRPTAGISIRLLSRLRSHERRSGSLPPPLGASTQAISRN